MASISTTAPRDLGNYRRSGLSWSAIFAGCFLFLAIEVTFGVLGMAIFASAAGRQAAQPSTGMSIGVGIWTVVLSIIALYFAGKTAGRLSGVVDRNLGVYHGLVTFGMSIFASVLLFSLAIGSSSMGVNATRLSAPKLISDLSTGGWWLFIALLLGFVASATGGSHGAISAQLGFAAPANIDREKRAA